MRKIKFRIWHKKELRWLDPWAEEDPMLCLKDFGRGCEVYLYDRQSKDWTNKDCQMDDVVIQQFTGLTDEKDRSVYEGDIVRSGLSVTTVEWDDNIFYWGNASGLVFNFDPSTMSQNGDYEVIGNIFDGVLK